MADTAATDVNPAISAQLERTARVQALISAILSSPNLSQIQRALSDSEISSAALADSGAAQLRGLLEAAGMSEQAKEVSALQASGAPLTREERTAIVEAIKTAPAVDTPQVVTACATVVDGVPLAGAAANTPNTAVVAGAVQATPEKVDAAVSAAVPTTPVTAPTTEPTTAQVDAAMANLLPGHEARSGQLFTDKLAAEQAVLQNNGAVR